MERMKLIVFLRKISACRESVSFCDGKSARECWDTCDRGDWMLTVAKRANVDIKILTLAKVRCARLVQNLMKDERSLNALDVAEAFARGEATADKLRSAVHDAAAAADAAYAAAADYASSAAYADSYAAYAASSAAYADSYAAYAASYAASAASYADTAAAKKDILKKCADICRETIDFNLIGVE